MRPGEGLATLGRQPGREWVLAEGLRTTAGGRIICVSHVFIHQDFAATSPDPKTHKGAIHRLIKERFGVRVAEVHPEISTVTLEGSMAQVLGQPRGADAILVTRRSLADGDLPILVSFNWRRLESFRYSQVIRRA